ncbi:DUF3141 domain-containing protein [Deefgea piscis]|uniref:DUF3141 domain-containing protein n=1 Tax=Deefgea piscis TaxID=2739061 RepID=UPI001C81CC78|nr:DUF3141 domain-containing protein [Deefgea piscis]QZA80802.1 DUF3141 domain-containing protein [Deefgea piscis]
MSKVASQSSRRRATSSVTKPATPEPQLPYAQNPLLEYWIDAMQRTALFADLLRQRSEQNQAQQAKAVPHVLSFDAELVLDARTFATAVNYLLVRVKPTAAQVIDPKKRPFVVVDPRAGHGPGIGGFKADSEIGVAMAAGHPCYFVGFTPDPMPGQTIEDIMHAEAKFLEKVIELHPDAEGKPCIIGNCQAGWAVMMLAATRPELCGPVIVPGAPLSYWAGVEGENPMRYTGGLSGGSWITALTSDLGGGIFDGGNLVKNFENLNPANTLWGKNYDIWSNIDHGGARFLEFEKWWGGHVNLNGEEIQWIVDQLFIGNRLSSGQIVTQVGEPIDLRNIHSPIICFCSKGDNITPPQQALGWINDVYASDDELRLCGQTIVYAVHDHVGHLGIFVSGSVAKKEHQEFASNIDLIDVLPPGLYEAVLTPKTAEVLNPEWVEGDWIVRFESRTLTDIRQIVQPNQDDALRFATVARVSEINLEGYRRWIQPWVRLAVNTPINQYFKACAAALAPASVFSPQNPLMSILPQCAEWVRQHRQPVAADNPFLKWQEWYSEQMMSALNGYRDQRDHAMEQLFISIYGSPLLQQMLSITEASCPAISAITPERQAFIQQRIAHFNANMAEGGLREAVIRALLYIGMAGDGVDERSFNALRLIRSQNEALPLSEFKQQLREQYFSLRLDQERALATMVEMLPADSAKKQAALDVIRRIAGAAGEMSAVATARLHQIEALFMVEKKPVHSL